MEPTFSDRSRAIADALTIFKVLLNHRVMFEPLEFVKRAEMRVGIIEVDYQTNRNLVTFK